MAAMTERVRRRGARTRKGAVARFLAWWRGELGVLVPLSLRPKARPSPAQLWVSGEAADLVFRRLSGGKLEELGRLSLADASAESSQLAFNTLWLRLGRKPIGVCLRSDQVLRTQLGFPVAARSNLAQLVEFELPRQTPFSANQAYFDHELQREDLRTGRLQVLLTAVPRDVVDKVLDRLEEWGVKAGAVMVDDDLTSGGHCANLLQKHRRPKVVPVWRWIYGAMALVTLALLVAALGIPLWQKREQLIALQPVEAKASADASAVNSLREEHASLLAMYNFPLEKKYGFPATLTVLEEVTRILPDDTWLQQLELRGDKVLMQGSSRAPARLIGLFEKSSRLGEANFRSPLVKGREGEERFQLEAVVKPIAVADAVAAQKSQAQPGRKARAAAPGSRGSKPRAEGRGQ